MLARCHQAERAVRLALRTRADDHHPAGVEALDLGDVDHVLVVDAQDAERAEPLATEFCIERPRKRHDPLSASAASTTCWIRWMWLEKQATTTISGRASDDVAKHRPDAAFARRVPGLLGVRRVRQEHVDAAARFLGEAVQIGRLAVDRASDRA